MYSFIQTKRGFTLIELLVVIAIIGILASVVLAGLGTQRDSAREASALSGARSMVPVAQVCRDQGETISAPAAGSQGGDASCSDPFAVGSETYVALPGDWEWSSTVTNTGASDFSFTAFRDNVTANNSIDSGERRIDCNQNNCTVTTEP